MAAPSSPPSFLQSALSQAPLERGDESWAYLRFCDVLPADARPDFDFVRAHEVSRAEPKLPQRIASSLADRATPKGRKPDPKSARARAAWKEWEANGFKAPQYVAPWPNHSGTPIKASDVFPAPPAEIGAVRSATTNVHAGRVERDHLAGVFFALVIGGAPGALVGFVTAQFLDWLAVPVATGSAVVATALAYAVHFARTGRHHSTWVGTEGLATVTDGKVLVFRFERATRLDRKVTDQLRDGAVVGQRLECTWLNGKNQVVHRARALLPGELSGLPETAPAHFVRASEDAWAAFEARRRP